MIKLNYRAPQQKRAFLMSCFLLLVFFSLGSNLSAQCGLVDPARIHFHLRGMSQVNMNPNDVQDADLRASLSKGGQRWNSACTNRPNIPQLTFDPKLPSDVNLIESPNQIQWDVVAGAWTVAKYTENSNTLTYFMSCPTTAPPGTGALPANCNNGIYSWANAENTTAHEYGHALGLTHDPLTCVDSIMNLSNIGSSQSVIYPAHCDEIDAQNDNAEVSTVEAAISGLTPGQQMVVNFTVRRQGVIVDSSAAFVNSNGTKPLPLAHPMRIGDAYDVTFSSQNFPAGSCTATPSSGLVSQADANAGRLDIQVTCQVPTGEFHVLGQAEFTVLGGLPIVSGAATVVLNPGFEEQSLQLQATPAPQNFLFPDPLEDGDFYNVITRDVSSNMSCHVLNESGTVNGADVFVPVACLSIPDDLCEAIPELCVIWTWECNVFINNEEDKIVTSIDPQTGEVLGGRVVHVVELSVVCSQVPALTESTAATKSTPTEQTGPLLHLRTDFSQPLSGVVHFQGVARDDDDGISFVFVEIDGQRLPAAQVSTGEPDAWTCNEFPRPGCDPNGGVSWLFDTTDLADGTHTVVLNH